jgi:hypothetical protein
MKRILLVLCLLVTLVTQAQRVLVHTDKVVTGHWNNIEENWIWEKPKYAIINFLMQGNTVIADDVAESTYKLFDMVVDKTEFSMWNAIDEQDRECNFILDFSPPENISIMYGDVIYVYYISYTE